MSEQTSNHSHTGLVVAGWILIIAGILGYAIAFRMPISVYAGGVEQFGRVEVVNAALLRRQELVAYGSLAAFIAGCISLASGYVILAITRVRNRDLP